MLITYVVKLVGFFVSVVFMGISQLFWLLPLLVKIKEIVKSSSAGPLDGKMRSNTEQAAGSLSVVGGIVVWVLVIVGVDVVVVAVVGVGVMVVINSVLWS